MVVDEAINRGDKKKLLEFSINEKPVALQLGGSSPKLLAEATKVGEETMNEQGEVSLDEVSESENQEADVSSDDTEASNS